MLTSILATLRCPDDGTPLDVRLDHALCHACGRRYSRPSEGVLELVSKEAHATLRDVSGEFWDSYVSTRRQQLQLDSSELPWGAESSVPPAWLRLRCLYTERVVSLASRALPERDAVVADISAGPGYVSFALARRGIPTIHADLSAESVSFAASSFRNDGDPVPMLVVRADYFSLPFRDSVDVIVCTDSLIRGLDHEIALLKSIRQALNARGRAVVDFHNWMHNPLRRIGVLQDNFKGNRSYLRRRVSRVVRDAGLAVVEEVSYRQEEDQAGVRRLLARYVPPTRFLMLLRKRSR